MSLEHGIFRSFKDVIIGLLPAFLVASISEVGGVDPSMQGILSLLSIVGNFLLLPKMQYWNSNYLYGWLMGNFILYSAGLIDNLGLFLTCAFPIFLLSRRLYRKI